MSDRQNELSSDELAAFDSQLSYLEVTRQKSMSLQEFLSGDGDDDNGGDLSELGGNSYVKEPTAIMGRVLEKMNNGEIRLGQLSRNVTLGELIGFRHSLES